MTGTTYKILAAQRYAGPREDWTMETPGQNDVLHTMIRVAGENPPKGMIEVENCVAALTVYSAEEGL